MNTKYTLLNIMGNSIGALITFLYFSFVIEMGSSPEGGPYIQYVIFFIIGTGFIFLILITANLRWSRPLIEFSGIKCP